MVSNSHTIKSKQLNIKALTSLKVINRIEKLSKNEQFVFRSGQEKDDFITGCNAQVLHFQ